MLGAGIERWLREGNLLKWSLHSREKADHQQVNKWMNKINRRYNTSWGRKSSMLGQRIPAVTKLGSTLRQSRKPTSNCVPGPGSKPLSQLHSLPTQTDLEVWVWFAVGCSTSLKMGNGWTGQSSWRNMIINVQKSPLLEKEKNISTEKMEKNLNDYHEGPKKNYMLLVDGSFNSEKLHKEMWVCFEIIAKICIIKLYKAKSCSDKTLTLTLSF